MSKTDHFLNGPGPRVFTMPSGADFLHCLADGVCAALDDDAPYALSDAMILTPTRRAVRGLSQAFINIHNDQHAVLLPRIRAIGDVDADEPPFEPGALALQSPRAMSAEQRLFDLTSLIRARLRASGQNDALVVAMNEAQALARLIDEAHTENLESFDLAEAEFAERLAGQPEHVQRAAQFLDIVMQYWPEHLRTHKASDPAAYRAKVLGELARQWQDTPPDHLVIAAGSTGSVPATADLLGVIARLPRGAIILPGLDMDLSSQDWIEVEQSPGHPQNGLARLLHRLHLSRDDVKRWPGAIEHDTARLRRRLVGEALLPAQATAGWNDRLGALAKDESMEPLALVQKGLKGLALVEAKTEEEEALVLALAIRHTLDDPAKTAVLITPDRMLAERVRAALWRWNIEIDDSAGTPLGTTPLGVFLGLIAQSATAPTAPIGLAALIGSNFAALGMAQSQVRAGLQKLESRYLRGAQRHDSFDDLAQAINNDEALDDTTKALLHTITQTLGAAFACFHGLEEATMAKWAEAHIKAAQILAASDDKSGDQRLWLGREGTNAAALFRALISDANALENVTADEYWHVFETLMQARPIRPKGAGAARARILGPLEARMISADLVALGGLNEGSWPAHPGQDPFLPRDLRLKIGLPDPERRLGLAAHDFAEHTSKRTVLLTRAKRSGSDPAIASRWLWRLQTLIRCAADTDDEANAILAPDIDYLAHARALDQVPPDEVTPARAPAPTPPVHLRPRTLYVTRLKTLIRNPYAIYGRFILNLMPMDELGESPSHKQRGTAIHNALERFIGNKMDADDPNALGTLTHIMVEEIRAQGFAEHQIPALQARLKRAAAWVLEWQTKRQMDGWEPAMLEGQGVLKLTTKGEDFTIKAYADRIDRGVDGYAVIDYKTGTPPKAKEVAAGFDPQLPLEAAILEHGQFTKDAQNISGTASALLYVKVSGGSKPGEETRLDSSKQSAAEFQARALDDLHKLIDWFDQPQNPYLCQPRAKYTDSFSDYDLLARRAEWAATDEKDEGADT